MDKDINEGLVGKYRVMKTSSVNYGLAMSFKDPGIIQINGLPMEEVVEPCMVMKFSDPHARKALKAFAESCQDEFPQLHSDIMDKLVMTGDGLV